jgi:chemotaxis protein MotB
MPRRKRTAEKKHTQRWLITFADLTALLLTFFVLLLSMAVIDERRMRTVLFTVRGSLGMGMAVTTPLSDKNIMRPVTPGVFDLPTDDLEPLRDMLWEDPDLDVTLQSNRFIEIISIHADALFEAGETDLSPDGRVLLSRIAATLQTLDYPILLAGHTSPTRDEIQIFHVSLNPYDFSPTWELSFLRALSVYELFRNFAIPENKLKIEGFGEYRPRVSNNTALGRTANRRVDIVLDKRERQRTLPQDLRNEPPRRNLHKYEHGGFIFDLSPLPPPPTELR